MKLIPLKVQIEEARIRRLESRDLNRLEGKCVVIAIISVYMGVSLTWNGKVWSQVSSKEWVIDWVNICTKNNHYWKANVRQRKCHSSEFRDAGRGWSPLTQSQGVSQLGQVSQSELKCWFGKLGGQEECLGEEMRSARQQKAAWSTVNEDLPHNTSRF